MKRAIRIFLSFLAVVCICMLASCATDLKENPTEEGGDDALPPMNLITDSTESDAPTETAAASEAPDAASAGSADTGSESDETDPETAWSDPTVMSDTDTEPCLEESVESTDFETESQEPGYWIPEATIPHKEESIDVAEPLPSTPSETYETTAEEPSDTVPEDTVSETFEIDFEHPDTHFPYTANGLTVQAATRKGILVTFSLCNQTGRRISHLSHISYECYDRDGNHLESARLFFEDLENGACVDVKCRIPIDTVTIVFLEGVVIEP